MTLATKLLPYASLLPVAFLGLALVPGACAQQTASASSPASLVAFSEVSALRDAPGVPRDPSEVSSSSAPQPARTNLSAQQPMAGPTDKYIAPGQPVPTLTAGNKIALGIKDAISPLSFIGWALSAGYEQGTNGSPNYGTNGKAFAQRFGASAARATSEGIFSDSILSPVLHEDPRYYRLGPGNNFIKRAGYAATRSLITRTDGGRATPNLAQLGGNLAGAYLTKAYYPALNTTNTEVLKTFGGSVGGSALGFVVSEFLSGTLNIFHISKPAQD